MSPAARLLALFLTVALSPGAQAEDEASSDANEPESPVRRVEPLDERAAWPLIEVATERCRRCGLEIAFTLLPDATVVDPTLHEETRCPERFAARVLEEAWAWKYEWGKGLDPPRGGFIFGDPGETGSGRVTVECPGPCSCPCLGVDTTDHGRWSEQTDRPGVWTRKESPDRILGALVQDVTAGSPASLVGIQPADLILQVNSRRVHEPAELLDEIDAAAPGEGFEAVLLRQGLPRTLTGILGEHEPGSPCRAAGRRP